MFSLNFSLKTIGPQILEPLQQPSVGYRCPGQTAILPPPKVVRCLMLKIHMGMETAVISAVMGTFVAVMKPR